MVWSIPFFMEPFVHSLVDVDVDVVFILPRLTLTKSSILKWMKSMEQRSLTRGSAWMPSPSNRHC